MNDKLHIPPEWIEELLRAEDRQLTVKQGGYELHLRLTEVEVVDALEMEDVVEDAQPSPSEMLDSAIALLPLESPSAPLFRMSGSAASALGVGSKSNQMKLELVDDSEPQLKAIHADPMKEELPKVQQDAFSLRSKDMFRTQSLPLTMAPVDYHAMLSDSQSPEKPISMEVVVGAALDDTQPDPEEDPWLVPSSPPHDTAPSAEDLAPAFSNAFLDDDEGWLVTPTTSFRALRTTDTPKVLALLFGRLETSLEQLDRLLPESQSRLSPSQLAKAAGLVRVLPLPIPFSTAPDAPPTYHLVGQTRDGSFVLLYQDEEDQTLHSTSVPSDGGTLQIALVEGEELLTDDELTDLFKEGAREATPEEAEARALQLQSKLRNNKTPTTEHKPLALRPISIRDHRGLEKAIPVNDRLLKRFDFNRKQDKEEHLWDQSLQPGVAVFRYNIATLFQDEQALIEGVLLCLIARGEYLVFDRRTKRSVPLLPQQNQRIWLRHDESLE